MIWKNLDKLDTLTQIDESSGNREAIIFKHSTRCSISTMALSRLERSWNSGEMTEVDAYFLDLLANRDISNAIAERYGIDHQSPQVLIIKSGTCVYSASHMDISYDGIKAELSIS